MADLLMDFTQATTYSFIDYYIRVQIANIYLVTVRCNRAHPSLFWAVTSVRAFH